jgi:hypothetical protein
MFYWCEPVLYLDPVSKFPETPEKPGYFVGSVDDEIPCETTFPWPDELPDGITTGVFGIGDTYKTLKAVTERFFTCEIFI